MYGLGVCLCAFKVEPDSLNQFLFQPFVHSNILCFLTYHYAGVKLIEALHCAVAEAVAEVFLDEVGVVQDVICHQWLLK